MAKEIIEVDCPCCRTNLKIDTVTGVIVSHKQPETPPPIEDLATAGANLKGDAARREEVFQKSFADQKNRKNVLDRKFDELLKQAKSDPDTGPPKREFDFD
jgi:hypothetical protein